MSEDRLRGRASDSAGPEPQFVAPGRYRVRPDDRLAAGTPPGSDLLPGQAGVSTHLGYQAIRPSAAAVVHQHGDRIGPMAESVTTHAQIAQLDQARASNGTLESQLGPRMPSPVPGQPPEHTVATNAGAPFRENAPRDRGVYSREPKAT